MCNTLQQIAKTLTCELPFMLNLPSDDYVVDVGGKNIHLLIVQECFALYKDSMFTGIFPKTGLTQINSKTYDTIIPLHTVVQTLEQMTLPMEWKDSVSKQDVKEVLQAGIIGQKLAICHCTFQENELSKTVEEEFKKLQNNAVDYNRYELASFARKFAWDITSEFFIEAINRLIKSYMAFFKDHFVHEITMDTLADSDSLKGVMCLVYDQDGNLLDRKHRIGYVPAIMRQPWIQRREDDITKFKVKVQTGQTDDPVALLRVRANHFLLIGEYRSAIIEASAALEISLTRKIREGMATKGKSETDIDTFLKDKQSQQFTKRAKDILKCATGYSAADFCNPLWERVLKHREDFRHKIAHSDKEPDSEETKNVISDFGKLTDYIEGIAIK